VIILVNIIEEKEKLINTLSEQYSRSIINLNDYESMVDRVNKVDSLKTLRTVQKEVAETCELTLDYDNNDQKNAAEYSSVFSWRTITAKSINGNAGKFSSVFGGMHIKIDSLPPGVTTIKVEAVFSVIEIFVPKNIKIVNKVTPVFSGVFAPDIGGYDDNDGSVLQITGDAVFGNITVIRT